MSQLAPDLFQRRYRDLVELAVSRLPSLAPAWTDHNAHDPGITLVELLAWVGEAQLYGLSRMRRDERLAYAALMGVTPHGPRPARALLWPDHDDPEGPAAKVRRGRVVEAGIEVRLDRAESAAFRTLHRQWWAAAELKSLVTRLPDGTLIDHSEANYRGGPAFLAFGSGDGRGAVLRMGLAARGAYPLFEDDRPEDARLIVGVRSDASRGPAATGQSAGADSRLAVTLIADDERTALPVIADDTLGLLRSGAIVLDLSGVASAAQAATLEFASPAGFERPPRLVRIEPNAMPVIQRIEVIETGHSGTGLADQGFDLETPGLEFEPGSDPVAIEVAGEAWSKVTRLADSGPQDRVFALDESAARVSFGNGINGAVPLPEAPIVARYSASAGQAGQVAANRKWVVPGFTGVFGVNVDPTSGADDISNWLEQRREARLMLRDGHPLVSATDFEAAALALPGLEVARARVVPPTAADGATGTLRLVAMRARGPDTEGVELPENARWLAAVAQRLAPRVPLGMRLRVIAPAYARFAIRARIEAAPGRDPARVKESIARELARRLALVEEGPGTPARPFGLRVTRRDLVAWIGRLPDVGRVAELAVLLDGRRESEEVPLAAHGLPQIDLAASVIAVTRAGIGDAP